MDCAVSQSREQRRARRKAKGGPTAGASASVSEGDVARLGFTDTCGVEEGLEGSETRGSKN